MTEILCGDSTKILESIDIRPTLICCDPPYLIPSIKGGGTMNTKHNLGKSLEALKSKDFDITAGYNIRSFAKTVDRLQRGNINAYFFCNKLQIPEYLQVYVTELKCKFDLLSWHKTNAMPTFSNKYLSDTEYILFFHKGKGHTKPRSYDMAKTYWVQPLNATDKKSYMHPTIKPLNIVKTLVENSSNAGDLVLDPFCGSGTTGVACALLGRDFIGIDSAKTYVDIAIKRINDIKKL